MADIAVVIPNHLDNLDFLKEWGELRDYPIIVMQDIGKKPKTPRGFDVTIFDHADVAAELGEDAWIIPSRTSACRSYGYYKAWQLGTPYILTLDNDCYPERDSYLIDGHRTMLNTPCTLDWWENNERIEYTRGYPYLIRGQAETWLNHGLWSKVPDLDAATWLQDLQIELAPYTKSHTIPRHNFTPMCGMNLAWRRDLTPALYFGLFGPDYGFDQYDDIFAGVLVKKVLDHLGYAMRSGYPSLEHRKQSNVFVNLNKQAPGLLLNEHFWRAVQGIQLTGADVQGCYRELITKLPDTLEGDVNSWLAQFKRAALIWSNLYAA